MTPTPIQALAAVRDAANERQHAIELVSKGTNPADQFRWDAASRHWSQQFDVTTVAMLHEVPRNIGDALSLAIAACEHTGIFFPATAPALETANTAAEQIEHALEHMVVFLASMAGQPTPSEAATVRICRRLVAERDPGSQAADERWRTARKAYEAAKVAEDAAGHDVGDAPADVRYAAEEALMAVPSPDAAAFALKYLIAHGGGRQTDCWTAMLDSEAKRFGGVAA